ncbi:hypothetical protein WMO64_16505 [Pseudoflavonifractor sp. CLA-AP-H29]|uniref:Uncharacterized protein n=1 Tax=Pseudoflavonifractor intestinihominis TaxID=3133171 RepID=A0ABV1ECL0_9FIRM
MERDLSIGKRACGDMDEVPEFCRPPQGGKNGGEIRRGRGKRKSLETKRLQDFLMVREAGLEPARA